MLFYILTAVLHNFDCLLLTTKKKPWVSHVLTVKIIVCLLVQGFYGANHFARRQQKYHSIPESCQNMFTEADNAKIL